MEESAARAHLARCPRRAHLGRHQRDPAPHHLARAAAAAGRLTWRRPHSLTRLLSPQLHRLHRRRTNARSRSSAPALSASPARSGPSIPSARRLAASPACRSVDEIDGSSRCRLRRGEARADHRHRRAICARSAAAAPSSMPRASAETGDTAGSAGRARSTAADGMPLMGPNCYGFVNGMARAALWPDEHGVEPARARRRHHHPVRQHRLQLHHDAPRPAAGRRLRHRQSGRCRHGRRCWKRSPSDERITAIGLHIEGLQGYRRLRQRRRDRARDNRKPVIALKTGRSEQGAKVAMSHTSSLAGADTLYDALFERYGIARMTSVTRLRRDAEIPASWRRRLNGNRLVSMSCSGGEAALVADMALEKQRALSRPSTAAPSRRSPPRSMNMSSIDNPLDYHTFIWNEEDKLTATFSAVLAGGFDVGMLILDIPTSPAMRPDTWLVTAKALMNAAKATKARAPRWSRACPNACRVRWPRPGRGRRRADDGPRRRARPPSRPPPSSAATGRGATSRRLMPRPPRAAAERRPLTEYRRQAAARGPRPRRA